MIESKKACRLPALVSAAPTRINRYAAKADCYALATRSMTFRSCVFAVGGLPNQPSARGFRVGNPQGLGLKMDRADRRGMRYIPAFARWLPCLIDMS